MFSVMISKTVFTLNTLLAYIIVKALLLTSRLCVKLNDSFINDSSTAITSEEIFCPHHK